MTAKLLVCLVRLRSLQLDQGKLVFSFYAELLSIHITDFAVILFFFCFGGAGGMKSQVGEGRNWEGLGRVWEGGGKRCRCVMIFTLP